MNDKPKNIDELTKELKICRAELAVLKEEKQKREQAEERLYFLNDVFQAAINADDDDESIRIVLQLICEKTKCVFGQLWMVDETKLKLSPIWYSEHKDIDAFRKFTESKEQVQYSGFLRKALNNKSPIWIQDISCDEEFPRVDAAKSLGIKAALAVPIFYKDKVVAIMELFMLEEQQKDIGLLGFILVIAAQIGGIFKSNKL